MLSLYALVVGFLLDLCFGDPYSLPHPIRLIGTFIDKAEQFYRKLFRVQIVEKDVGEETKKEFVEKENNKITREKAAGFCLVLTVCVVSTGIPIIILYTANKINPYLKLLLESIMCYQLLATKSLKTESMKVYNALKENDTEKARKAVSMIVGRDTQNLTDEGIAKAAIETVAENTSDGSIAPLIYMAIFGAAGGFFYKSINTMDSMVGYKNDKYINFGCVAAKTDDLLNYIPARLSAWIMVAASIVLKYNWKNAIKIYRRDRYNHASPNSAHTEAVCAGALEISLAGDAFYFGKLYKKKTIGDGIRKIEYEDIKRANNLLYGTALVGIILAVVFRITFLYIVK